MHKTVSLLIMCLCPILVFSQGRSMLDFDANIAPSAETFTMIKYGAIHSDLYTGAISYNVPIFTYEDLDFTIPISLSYCFNGYKPSMASGSVGLGWCLNTGGVITREVHGVPDEQYLTGDIGIGGWLFTVQNISQLDTLHYYRHGPYPYVDRGITNSNIDLFNAVPCFKEPVATPSSSESVAALPSYEACPDLFHFNIDGISGSFVLGSDGHFHFFGDNVPFDLFDVEITPVFGYPGGQGLHEAPSICLTRKDGYQFYFGGDISHIEFGRGCNQPLSSDEVNLGITAFHLKEIIAPNGRSVTFLYGDKAQRVQVSTLDTSHKISGSQVSDTHQIDLIEHPYSCFRFLLEGIDVDDVPFFRCNYSSKDYDEYAAGYYEVSTNSAVWDVSQIGITLDNSPKKLDAIFILNAVGDTVKTVALSHCYSSAVNSAPKMFLRSISDSMSGRMEFHYRNDSMNDKYPYSDTKGIDHWGYWNGRNNSHTAAGFIPVSTTDQQDTTLYRMSTQSRDAVFTYASYGAINRIVYPTGGESLIDYEPHSVPSMVVDEIGSGPTLKPNYFGVVPGGVRVKRTVSVDGPRRDTTIILYCIPDSSSRESGELLFMPRYVAQEPFNINIDIIPHDNPFIVPYGFAIGLSAQSGLNLFCGNHIGYRYATIIYPDGSRTEQRFVGYGESPDVRSMQLCNKYYNSPFNYISCGPNDYDHLQRYLLPCFDGSLLRGKQLYIKDYTAEGTLVEETQNNYNGLLAYECPIGENVISTMVKGFINYHSVMPASMVHSFYTDCGPVIIRTLYQYDSLARETCRASTHSEDISGNRSFTAFNNNGWISDVVSTVIRNGSEYITGRKKYYYDNDNPELPAKNPRPTEIREYILNAPVLLTNNDDVWSVDMQTAGGTNSIRITTLSYYPNYFPKKISLNGGKYTEYAWDGLGRNIVSKTMNASTNRWHYNWKDLVGLSQETDPAGIITDYFYDEKNRLRSLVDGKGNIISEYEYHLENE